MTIDQGTEYQARARATLGAEMGQLVEMLTTDQLNALAAEVVREVLTNDRGFSEYVAEYVCNITYSSASDADRLRKLRSYADLMMTSEDRVEAVTDHERNRWAGGGAGGCPDCGEFCREGDDCTSEHYAQTVGEGCNLEVCVDCAHLIANGEIPEDRPEFELLGEWDGYHIALVLGDDSTSFSWAQCDGCGSRLGGDRHKAVALKVEDTTPTRLEEFTEAFPGVPVEVLTELIEGHDGYSPDDMIFEGEHDNYSDLAFELVESTGDLDQVPEWLRSHIDYDSIGRDLDCGGMYEIRHNGSGFYWTIG